MFAQKGFYCYKWVMNDEIIYVGKTTEPFRRIKEERSDSKFRQFSDANIYILRLNNSKEMDFMEKILINHYQPLLNDIGRSDSFTELPIIFEDLDWVAFEDYKYQLDITDDKDKRIIELEDKLEEANKTIIFLRSQLMLNEKYDKIRTEKEKEFKYLLQEYKDNNDIAIKKLNQQIDDLISKAALIE